MRRRHAHILYGTGWIAVACALGIVLVSCGEVCEICGVPGAGTGNAPGSPPVLREVPSYGFDIQPIWDKNCVMCHHSGGIAQTVFGVPMSLTSGQALDDLINKPSATVSGRTLIVPGDAAASYLFEKVDDADPASGARMPLFQPALLDEEIELIRRWIEAGASGD